MPGPDQRVFELSQIAVPELLTELLTQRFSGEVVFEGESIERHVVGFAGGLPRWCEARVPASRLGVLLVDAGAVTEEEIDDLVAKGGCGQGRRLGECLIEQRVVEKGSVRDALRRQCELRLVDLCGLSDGKATAMPGDTVKHAAYPIGRIYPTLLAGVRKHFDAGRLDALLGERLQQLITGTRLLRRRRKEFDFTKEEDAAVDELQAPDGLTFEEWLRRTRMEETSGKQLLYALFASSLVESAGPVTKTPRRPTSETPVVRQAPVDLSVPKTMPRDPHDLARFLTARKDDDESPYAALGLESAASLEMIDGAGAVIQSRLETAASEGSGTLRCEAAARRVDALVIKARSQREKTCEVEGRRACEEERWPEALVLYEDLLELRKGDVPARVALAWIRYQLYDRTPEDARRALDRLDFLSGSDAAPPEVHAYRGCLLSELEDYGAAAKAFERAVALDPEDEDSARRARDARANANRVAVSEKPPVLEESPRPRDTDRPPLLSGRWPLIWVCTGLALVALVAAQIVLRMNF